MKLAFSIILTALALTLPLAALAAGPADDWVNNCSSCHGHDGDGHTRVGRMLRIVDLTDMMVQKNFTDEQAFNAVKDGFIIRGSTKMKPFKDKLTDDEIKALIVYVRTLAK